MRKFLQTFVFIMFLTFAFEVNAQRYLTEIFDSYQLVEDVTFGVNVNPLISTFPDPADPDQMAQWQGEMDFLNDLVTASLSNPDTLLDYPWYFYPNGAIPGAPETMVKIVPLEMDVYLPPETDTETARPVFLYLHTGNFLPPLFNGGITGDKIDSAAVNICKQMAKRGYVAASVNYRLGWNPLSTDENVRRGTLLQAVFRAIHDTQSAVRFFHSPAGTQFGVDPDKIALLGQGSGGYVAQAYATLDDYNTEIAGLPKFINTNTGFPFVIEAIDGTIEGGGGFVRLNDPLYTFNFSKDIALSVNMGGALADSSWLEEGDVPMVSFHCIRDPYAPFDNGMVVVPTTNENVVPVDGANVFIRKANEFGNNDVFADIPDGDPYTDAARSHYGQTYDYIYATQPTITVSEGAEGLYPFLLPLNGDVSVFGNQGAPWDWWDFATLQVVVDQTNAALGTDFDATALHQNGLFSNPDMSAEKGLTYIDTIQGYLQPRAVLAMDLVTGIANNPAVKAAMSIYPNPSVYGRVTIENNKAPMSQIVIMDAIGREIFRTNVNGNSYILNHDGWQPGLYFITVLFEEGGQLTRKLIIR